MRIVIAGTFADVAGQGGATWAVLQYVLGFRQLGHDVLLVEPVDPDPEVIGYFDRLVIDFELRGHAALLHPQRCATGLPYTDVASWMQHADVLVNLAGVLRDDELTAGVARRLYVDLDPAFTQLWAGVARIDMNFRGHHRFVTVGQAIGTPGCRVPRCGIDWIPTVPPVVLDRWPVASCTPSYGLTTVGNWRSYGSITHAGVHYGQKAHAVRQLLQIPRLVEDVVTEPAFAIDEMERADLEALATSGWRLQPPSVVAEGPIGYQSFIQASTAELGVAKSGYVASRSGWFSDRSVCYLASGRPVVAQDTGWPAFLPEGDGLRAFRSAEEAAVAVRDVLANPARHARGARALAHDYFDARLVLRRLLDVVGAA